MKKTTFVSVLIILFLGSCQKGNSPTDGGSWTFKSQTYNAPFCSYILGALTASTESGTPSGTIAFYFYDSTSNATLSAMDARLSAQIGRDTFIPRPITTFPPKLGTYIVTNKFNTIDYSGNIYPDSGYVYVQLTDTAAFNYYQVSSSANVVVTVTKAANGFLTVTLPPVMMVNKNNTPGFPQIGVASGKDSSLVSGTIKQTQ